MKIEYEKYVTKAMVQKNRHKLFLFGDNLAKKGYGGQAKNMRGEPNALGIPTKKYPSLLPFAFFVDKEYESNCKHIDAAFDLLYKINPEIVVIPEDGIGTGMARMRDYCPKTYLYLQDKLKEIEKWNFI